MSSIAELRRATYFRLFGADAQLRSVVSTGTRVLDVGCSDGRGSEILGGRGTFGVDIYRPALAAARASGRRSPVVQADVRSLPYADDAFDVVVCLDVLEHFEKPDALRVLDELERVARATVVVMTPRGFVPQPPTEDEPWQEHRCGFEPDELRGRGYRVSGLGGPAALRGPYGRFRFGAGGKLATALAVPVARRHAEAAFALLGVKVAGG
jgi:SAM-dependent methyltransferase